MIRITRSLVRLFVGLFTVAPLAIGSVAYAATEPVGGNSPGGTVTFPDAGTSFVQQVAWMVSGAAIVLLFAGLVAGIAVLSKRHRIQTRQLRMP